MENGEIMMDMSLNVFPGGKWRSHGKHEPKDLVVVSIDYGNVGASR